MLHHYSCANRSTDSQSNTDTAQEAMTIDDSSHPVPQTAHKIELFAIILAPTQELVRQIWSEAVRLSSDLQQGRHFLSCLTRRHYADRCKRKRTVGKEDTVVAGASNKSSGKARRKIRELRLPRSTKILITTPDRMASLLTLDSNVCPFDLSRYSNICCCRLKLNPSIFMCMVACWSVLVC